MPTRRGEFKREPTREMSVVEANRHGVGKFGEYGWPYFKKEWNRITKSLQKFVRSK